MILLFLLRPSSTSLLWFQWWCVCQRTLVSVVVFLSVDCALVSVVCLSVGSGFSGGVFVSGLCSGFSGPSVRADGPNPDYHHGSMANLATGSSGACGPNPALRCGAEHPSPMATMGLAHMQSSV